MVEIILPCREPRVIHLQCDLPLHHDGDHAFALVYLSDATSTESPSPVAWLRVWVPTGKDET